VSPRRERWKDLSPARRRLLVTVGVIDAGLRAWALLDLRTRPAEEVNGPKAAWGLALTVVSSAGLLPATYVLIGRRHRPLLPLD